MCARDLLNPLYPLSLNHAIQLFESSIENHAKSLGLGGGTQPVQVAALFTGASS